MKCQLCSAPLLLEYYGDCPCRLSVWKDPIDPWDGVVRRPDAKALGEPVPDTDPHLRQALRDGKAVELLNGDGKWIDSGRNAADADGEFHEKVTYRVGPDAPVPLTKRMRQCASCLSYNDKAPIPAVKHTLIEAAMRIEALEREGKIDPAKIVWPAKLDGENSLWYRGYHTAIDECKAAVEKAKGEA